MIMPFAAFMIGLLGSFHCLGMCGPLAFALPVRTSNKWVKLLKYLLYNLGRVFTYAVLGVIIGFVGKGFKMAGLQQTISILTGVLIIVSVLLVHNPVKLGVLNKITGRIKDKLKGAFKFYFQKTGVFALFTLGVLNGLLPCGMVYMALLGALATGSSFSGAGFMAAFGLGTVPMMLGVSILGNMVGFTKKSLFLKAVPVVACIVGGLLIIRGLNLNIPYLSPGEASCCQVQKCH